MTRKNRGWPGESRRKSLARRGIKTNINKDIRFDVSNYVARGDAEDSLRDPIGAIYIGAELDFVKKGDLSQTGTIKDEIIEPPLLIGVSPEEYDNIAFTLDDLSENVLEQLVNYETEIVGLRNGAMITDDKRFMIIDTQGHNYPRYKSAITLRGGKLLRFK